MEFKCLLCDCPMLLESERLWRCRICGFFYRTLKAFTVPAKYLEHPRIETKRRCGDCKSAFVTGIKKYCERCAKARKTSSNRTSQRKKRHKPCNSLQY